LKAGRKADTVIVSTLPGSPALWAGSFKFTIMEEPMTDEQYWWLSDFNLKPEVMGENHLPKRIKIYDTTLRDGEQTIGVSFDRNEKLEIAKLLDEMGVDRIEAGMPVVSKEDRDAIELILKAGLRAEIWGFCRAVKGDVEACADVGMKHVVIEIATSHYKMKANNFTPDGVLGKVVDTVHYAKSRGLYVAFFAVDATRADIRYLETIYKKAVNEAKADEVVMVDTLGVATPETIYYLTKKLSEWVKVPIMIHCHSDFGLGTACSFASVKAGADCIHATINGLGEKTGNADIAEIAIAAKLYGVETNINLKKLYRGAKYVEKISKIPISPMKPVVGDFVFKRESGVTAAQVISFPPAVEPYSPELLGREREVLLSKKSGKRSVEYRLEKLNVKATSEQADEILKKVKDLGVKKKGLVSDDEFKRIINEVIKTMGH
jgi:isopropylmalate/homocitrate/citramalate synthase